MRRTLCLVGFLAAACGEDDAQPLFPADYAVTYLEVRSCRTSADHDLSRIRVLADPTAQGPYALRDAPFPIGSIVLKAEYDFADVACSGEILRWSVMERLAADATAEQLGWRWQQVDSDRTVKSEDDAHCIRCHTACGVLPDGYQGTCAVP